jgi:hypothetical protein
MSTQTRAWDLQPGDFISPIAPPIQTVDVDAPGTGGREVRVVTYLGTFTYPLNAMVTIYNDRETGLMA